MQVDMTVKFPRTVGLALEALTAKFKLAPEDKALFALALIQAMLAGSEADPESLIPLAKEGARVSGLMLAPLGEQYADKGIRL